MNNQLKDQLNLWTELNKIFSVEMKKSIDGILFNEIRRLLKLELYNSLFDIELLIKIEVYIGE